MKNSILAFFVSFVVIGGVLFFFPINLFSGEIVENSSGISKTISAPLSLSYFIGVGFQESEMDDVEDFYLTGEGYAMVFCFLFGLPFLIAFRIYLHSKNKS
ncbi:hypothetical protein N9335_01440 [Crocinitomicaceae bacterium]|nr:hypothetical protein [Crocinitomicaceae bacterium]